MPPLTFELVGVIITGILVPLAGAVLFVWKAIEKKIVAGQTLAAEKIEDVRLDREREEKQISERIKRLEENTVSKDEHNSSVALMNKALDNITLALRETGATLTSRIDLVLFEVGRQKNGKTE